VRRLGIRRVFAMGLGASALRLLVLALGPPMAIVVASQFLHAFTFGAVVVAGLIYINSRCPADLRASAQSIFNAGFLGAGGVLGSLVAGWFFDTFDMWTMMLAHAAIAGIGLVAFVLFFKPRSA